MKTHSLSGIINRITQIQDQLTLDEIRKASRSPAAFKDLQNQILGQLAHLVKGIEKSLADRNLTGADLAIRSRRAFQWLKFLSAPDTLLSHLDALQRFNLYLSSVNKKPGLKIQFSLYHLGSLYKVNHKAGIISNRIFPSLVAIAQNPSSKDDRGQLREYTYTKEYQQVRKRLEYLGILPGSFSAGKVHQLEESFHRVNRDYFQGKMTQPQLVWNRQQTHRKFGHYQWDTDTVMVSSSLDRIRVAEWVIDYVVYHELLHKKMGAKKVNQNRIAHSRKFKEAENQFKDIKKARQFLIRIAKKRARNP
jgi:hypothetical protein